jgi:CheY-like chemotaxis protein
MESHSGHSQARNDVSIEVRTGDGRAPSQVVDGDGSVGRHCQVLIVDDNRDAALSLAMILQLWGHSCHVVHNGADALTVAGTLRPDAVLLDIGLPDTDGSVVASSLRADPRLNGVVIVATTGHMCEEDAQHAQDAGFDHHFLKPLQLDLLQSLLIEIAKSGDGVNREASVDGPIPPSPRSV